MSPKKSKPCPPRKVQNIPLKHYWSQNPGCPYCVSSKPSGSYKVSIGGASTASAGSRKEPDWLLLRDGREWTVLESDEHERIQRELADLDATLSQEGIARDMALARFYEERGLELMRIHILDHALVTAKEPDAAIAIELAEALQRAGFPELALQTCDAVPTMITVPDTHGVMLLGKAMLKRGRILDALRRPIEADSAFAFAQHLYVITGQLRS